MSDLPAGVRGACRVLATGLLLVTGLSVCLVFINRPCPKMGAAAHRAAVTRRGAADPRPPYRLCGGPPSRRSAIHRCSRKFFGEKKIWSLHFLEHKIPWHNSLGTVKQGGLKEPPRASRPEQRTP